MYLIPVYAQTWNDTLTQYWLLLERNGTHCIEVESMAAATAFAEENDIPGRFITANSLPNVIFLLVDSGAKNLSDFYSWREITPGPATTPKEVWRNFIWTSSKDSDDFLGVNTFLANVSIGPSLTVYDSLKELRGSLSTRCV